MRRFGPWTVGWNVVDSHPQSWNNKVHDCRESLVARTCQIVSIQSAEKKNDAVRSGILTEMCPEQIKTHIHLNPTRLTDYPAVRSEIEKFPQARQPRRWTLAVLTCGQRGSLGNKAARLVREAKSDDGKGQGKKGKSSKRKSDDGKGKGKGGNHCWKWCHMEKDCFTLAKTEGQGVLDESEASAPVNTSVGGFGLCSCGNQCGGGTIAAK